MHFILDFDGVLYDTETFKQHMHECGISQSERSAALFTQLAAAQPAFDPTTLVFADARDFLDTHGSNCTIVSTAASIEAGNNVDTDAQAAFQSAKITQSGVADLVGNRVIVTGASKIAALQSVAAQYDDVVFIDDRAKYIVEAQSLDITAVQLCRGATTCAVGDTCVHSLHEVSALYAK